MTSVIFPKKDLVMLAKAKGVDGYTEILISRKSASRVEAMQGLVPLYSMKFKHGGKQYQTEFNFGFATDPYEQHEGDVIECQEVKPAVKVAQA